VLISWSDCLAPHETLLTWFLALLVGHLLDLFTIKLKLFTLKQKPLAPKTIFVKGQYVEVIDEWAAFYPTSNLRWLSSMHYWVQAFAVFAALYFIIKFAVIN
jgi:hypothetical protein